MYKNKRSKQNRDTSLRLAGQAEVENVTMAVA
jgi:hypothetical protein